MSKIICIDPGHGGKDPGGGSNNQFLEKNMVLDISKEQKKHFERNGIKVVMTRTKDEYLDSVPRTNRVKASGAKYCISNHINAFNGKAEGAETIHSIYANKKIAQGVLDVIVKLGAKYRRVFSKQGSNGDWYYMLRMTGAVETVIVEYGFADNASDTQKILKDWKKYAEAVARYYIEQVFNQKYIPVGKKEEPKPPVNKPVTKPTPKPVSKQLGVATVNVPTLNLRNAPSTKGKLIRKLSKGEAYKVWDEQNGWLRLGNDMWASWKNGAYMDWSEKPTPKPKPKTYKVGQVVKIKSSASKYATGQTIPARYKNKSYRIKQLKSGQVLISELNSWVYVKDVE